MSRHIRTLVGSRLANTLRPTHYDQSNLETSSDSIASTVVNHRRNMNNAINPAEEGAEAANPQFCTCGDHRVAVTGAGAVVGLAAAPAAAPGVLALLGFGSEGIIATSWAAAVQAGIGNVVAGSPFAVATSVGAGGALPVAGFVISAAGGMAVAGLGYAVYKACKTRPIICPTCGLPKSS